jgi:hypothetical protein
MVNLTDTDPKGKKCHQLNSGYPDETSHKAEEQLSEHLKQ